MHNDIHSKDEVSENKAFGGGKQIDSNHVCKTEVEEEATRNLR